MRAADLTWHRRAADAAFWALTGVAIVLLLAFLGAVTVWAHPAPALLRTCAIIVRTMPLAWRVPLFGLLLAGIGSLGIAVAHLLQQLIATGRLVRSLRQRERVASPPSLDSLARRLSLVGRIELVVDGDVYAFSVGLWRARIMFSTGMLGLLDADELQAVLLHEAHHVRHLDAAKVAIVRALARALFFLPLAQDLARRYETLKELAADEHAIEQMGDRWPLASALWKLASRVHDRAAVGVVVGAAGDTALRIQHVLHYPSAVKVPLVRSPARTVVSVMTAVFLIGLSGALVDITFASTHVLVCPASANGVAPRIGGGGTRVESDRHPWRRGTAFLPVHAGVVTERALRHRAGRV